MRSTMKVSKAIVTSAVALTGVLMLAFQNCGKLPLKVSDVSGALAAPNQLIENGNTGNDNVSVQIQQANGEIVNIDDNGNQTVVDNNSNDQSNESSQEIKEVPQILNEEEDDEDLQVCEYKDHQKHDNGGAVFGKQTGIGNSDTLADYKKMHCKKKEGRGGHGHRSRCLDLIQKPGVNVIDLAKLNGVSLLNSLKGNTVIYSSDPNFSYIKGVTIDHAVGKTILCGVRIARLDVKKGRLDLREGSFVKSCGEIKGTISKDDESSIDGAILD